MLGTSTGEGDFLRTAHRTVFRGTNLNSRIFIFTAPTCRPSAIAIRWTSTFRRTIAFRRSSSVSDQSCECVDFMLLQQAIMINRGVPHDSADRARREAAIVR
jgi:hypothetical protein